MQLAQIFVLSSYPERALFGFSHSYPFEAMPLRRSWSFLASGQCNANRFVRYSTKQNQSLQGDQFGLRMLIIDSIMEVDLINFFDNRANLNANRFHAMRNPRNPCSRARDIDAFWSWCCHERFQATHRNLDNNWDEFLVTRKYIPL